MNRSTIVAMLAPVLIFFGLIGSADAIPYKAKTLEEAGCSINGPIEFEPGEVRTFQAGHGEIKVSVLSTGTEVEITALLGNQLEFSIPQQPAAVIKSGQTTLTFAATTTPAIAVSTFANAGCNFPGPIAFSQGRSITLKINTGSITLMQMGSIGAVTINPYGENNPFDFVTNDHPSGKLKKMKFQLVPPGMGWHIQNP